MIRLKVRAHSHAMPKGRGKEKKKKGKKKVDGLRRDATLWPFVTPPQTTLDRRTARGAAAGEDEPVLLALENVA